MENSRIKYDVIRVLENSKLYGKPKELIWASLVYHLNGPAEQLSAENIIRGAIIDFAERSDRKEDFFIELSADRKSFHATDYYLKVFKGLVKRVADGIDSFIVDYFQSAEKS
jgi:hypothetical protein